MADAWDEHAYAMVGSTVAVPPGQLHLEDLDELLDRVARSLGHTLERLRGPSRAKPIVNARWIAMAEAREAGFTYHEIGRALCRDHTTVIHGVRQLRPYAGDASTA